MIWQQSEIDGDRHSFAKGTVASRVSGLGSEAVFPAAPRRQRPDSIIHGRMGWKRRPAEDDPR